MPKTIGYHYVKSGYGLWLPGDDRGHWSEAWDAQIGFIEPHTLHAGDPIRLRMARERMQFSPVRWTPPIIRAMEKSISYCAKASPWKIVAGSIESTHFHLLITYSGMDIERTVKWLSQQITKRVHAETSHSGPIFCEGYWCSYLFDRPHWDNTQRYIERHNERRGEATRPYGFICAD
jgi:REP element-mobilizing transposase RayT